MNSANVRIGKRGYKSRITKITSKGSARSRPMQRGTPILTTMRRQLQALTKTIETKEGTRKITGINLQHNNLTVFTMNPFESNQGAGDPMVAGQMQRIGDQITIQSVNYKFFVENSLGRSRVYYRFMLVRMAKGDTLSRATLFEGSCDNKMIDTLNVERFTILASKTFTVGTPNPAPLTYNIVTGVPLIEAGAANTGSRVFHMRIPGKKFGKRGTVTYEDTSASQLKFFDYKFCCVAYDWNGTPQDTNNVGFINDGFVKTYYKDA